MIRAHDISKRFGTHEVFSHVSFAPRAGEITAIIGPSGGGKSTLMRCLCVLERISSGSITLGDLSVDSSTERDCQMAVVLRREVAFVSQQLTLWPYRTVFANMAEGPLRVLRTSRHDVREDVERLAERLGIADQLRKYPTELSGGQQQRVALGRALAMRPRVLLLDEVTSWLDPETAHDVLSIVTELKTQGGTVVLISHQIELLLRRAESVYLLSDGELRNEGNPADIRSGRCSERCSEFLRRIGLN